MKILKYFTILIFSLLLTNQANAFLDKDGKGAQSTVEKIYLFLRQKIVILKKVKMHSNKQ